MEVGITGLAGVLSGGAGGAEDGTSGTSLLAGPVGAWGLITAG